MRNPLRAKKAAAASVKAPDSDILEAFKTRPMLDKAKAVLSAKDQTEEAFLGAQAILLINGLL